jgi:hypothetical protein
MMRFAECLPIVGVPKEMLITTMRPLMIDNSCSNDETITLTHDAERMIGEECQPSLPPSGIISTLS